MADRNAAETYQILLEQLRGRSFGWVVEQIQEQVRSGKAVVKAVSSQSRIESARFLDEETELAPALSGRRQRLAATVAYTDVERLEIAIKAIRSAIIEPTLMQEAVSEYFISNLDIPQKIQFEPDEFDEAPRLIVEKLTEGRRSSVSELDQALDKLMGEAGLGDQ